MSALLEPLLTPRDVARLLKVSLRTARKVMTANKPIMVGQQLRWTKARLEKFVNSGGKAWPGNPSKKDCGPSVG